MKKLLFVLTIFALSFNACIEPTTPIINPQVPIDTVDVPYPLNPTDTSDVIPLTPKKKKPTPDFPREEHPKGRN